MSLADQFADTAKKVAAFKTVPEEGVFAEFYSLYKQATAGDCSEGAPKGSDSLSVAKHNAWVALKGTSKEDAMKKYVTRAQELAPKYQK
ncbi:acyl-CoA-binding protein-like [Neocloeon triangulifer]|uniref:acyl-CoA-binding protein-like n=1 Tax=Neocloeon triangulifer TaxID=2078957 RepID=UPI00286F3AAE|nr:acyl-CoA-binding protein-like [Neocloeon triangulifer]